MTYGEGQASDKANNLRGQLYQQQNGGGEQTIVSYDFKGNPLETEQRLLDDATIQDVNLSTATFTTEIFDTAITYDALNRPVTQTDPGSNATEYTYDEGGLLKTVELNSTAYVQDIHYDAKGQREGIWYGNGTKTSYTYDEHTLRLRRLLTVKLSNNEVLQDLNYYYDPVGNITTIRDDAQQTIFYANTIISPTQEFTYDALYRLIEAKGREQIGTASFGSDDNYHDTTWMATLGSDAAQCYTQTYTYDEVGNITELQHSAGTGSYTRTYDYAAGNRLLNTAVGILTYSYTHDARGNMTAMPHLSAMDWNSQNQLSHITKGTNDAYYQYSNGQRIRKYVDKGSEKEERIYLGNYEVYRKYNSSNTLMVERETIYVGDDTGRIAMLEIRTQGSTSDDNNIAQILTRYIYSNHLQSASLELDEDAEVISYEEYHPYGTTSYQAKNASINATAKRYRYTGKERDEETGLYYHGARYYISWLCRWSAVDPLESEYAGWSSYNYGFCNPIKWMDSTGMGPEDPQNVQNANGPGAPSNPKVLEEVTIIEKCPISSVDNTRHAPYVMPIARQQDQMREISELEFRGYNLWGEAKEMAKVTSPLDASPGKLMQLMENIFNPLYRTAQQLTHRIAGQENVTNLDGTTAWNSTEKSEAAVKGRVMDFAFTATMFSPATTTEGKVVQGLEQKTLFSIEKQVAKTGFTVNPSKFDYFFGRVVSGSEHNIARSAQNLKDLTTLGIKNENQLMNVFSQALESRTVISTKTNQYGTTVMKSVNIGKQGSINVGFFYPSGNMSTTPSVSTIIPKIFK